MTKRRAQKIFRRAFSALTLSSRSWFAFGCGPLLVYIFGEVKRVLDLFLMFDAHVQPGRAERIRTVKRLIIELV